MTVPSTPLSISYNCSGTSGPYAIPFGFAETTDIKVTLTNPSGVSSVLINGVDYTVTCTAVDWDSGGTPIAWNCTEGAILTTAAEYATGYSLIISTAIPITQETDFIEGMSLLYKNFEDALDKLTRICLQLEVRIIILELAVIAGLPITPSTNINYLGKLSSDPDTTGWGLSQAVTVWGLYVGEGKYRVKYWDGTEILILG